jgi:hypothetical protein
MAVQLNGALVLLQAVTNYSILAISSLTLENLPHRIARSCVMIPNQGFSWLSQEP